MRNDSAEIHSLIKACKKNDRAAQKALYKMYFSYAMSIAMRYANYHEEAQEIMNDGFLKVFKHMNSFDESKDFKPWLRKILINVSIDHFKKMEKKIEEHWVGLEKEMYNVKSDEQDQLSYQEVLMLIRKLPPAYRTVFNLRAIEGYTHEEIATQLGISVGTSKSNYARAREKLKNALGALFIVES